MTTPQTARRPADVTALRYERGTLHVLDQTALPAGERWLALTSPDEIAEAIGELRVRGAPLLGIVGGYGLAVAARRAVDPLPAVEGAARLLSATRPTAVNLGRAIDRVLARAREADAGDIAETIEDEAAAIHDEEIEACRAIGKRGAALLGPRATVMTICNTGALATGGIGTALGVIRCAAEEGGIAGVWVPETRPLLQGSRLTTWELERAGIPSTLVTDAATGSLFARGAVDAVVVGADRIAANGDTANKVGTYVLAVLAARHGVPFYVAAPTSTIDVQTASGVDIPIEERAAEEVRLVRGVPLAPSAQPVLNPAFDVTPAELITAIVTDTGVHRPPFRLGEAA